MVGQDCRLEAERSVRTPYVIEPISSNPPNTKAKPQYELVLLQHRLGSLEVHLLVDDALVDLVEGVDR
ncbi:MAG: hypothetical protein ACNA7R_15690, partial [Natronococcus sp.]